MVAVSTSWIRPRCLRGCTTNIHGA